MQVRMAVGGQWWVVGGWHPNGWWCWWLGGACHGQWCSDLNTSNIGSASIVHTHVQEI